MIDMFMVPAMFARPHQDRVLERARAEDEGKQTHRPACFECDMGEEPVIAEADAETAGGEERGEKRKVKPVDSELPEIERHGLYGELRRRDEERTGGPVDAVTRDVEESPLAAERFLIRGGSDLAFDDQTLQFKGADRHRG